MVQTWTRKNLKRMALLNNWSSRNSGGRFTQSSLQNPDSFGRGVGVIEAKTLHALKPLSDSFYIGLKNLFRESNKFSDDVKDS